jgi:protein TonB
MSDSPTALPEVFTPREIARAAGVPVEWVRDLIADGRIPVVHVPRSRPRGISREPFIAHRDAVRAARLLLDAGGPLQHTPDPTAAGFLDRPALFAQPPFAAGHPAPAWPVAASAGVHAAALLLAVLVASVGPRASMLSAPLALTPRADNLRLVYLVLPGPGGGGGGGGRREATLPSRATRKGHATASSPLPERQPPAPVAPPPPSEQARPPLKAEDLPPVVAPVATMAADVRDHAGTLEESAGQADVHGPGSGGGAGTGTGTGIGSGDGSGIGPGSGGGMGGGPYRPGSGVEPPRLLREVKPEYTESARRHGTTGEVVLEVVIRRDGTVGDLRVLRGLDDGLTERAIAAVRQWRFAPGRRLGSPVDVMVEVAVEFRLR